MYRGQMNHAWTNGETTTIEQGVAHNGCWPYYCVLEEYLANMCSRMNLYYRSGHPRGTAGAMYKEG
jgi:hypothetical protein